MTVPAAPVTTGGRGRRDVGLRRRLGLGLAAAATVLTLLMGGAAWGLSVVDDRERIVTGLYFRAISEADSTYIAVVDAESAFRGYLLTGVSTALEPFDRLLAPLAEGEGDVGDQIESVLGADHTIVAARAAAGEAARRWFTEFVEPSRALVETQGVDAVSDADVERGVRLFDDVRVAAEHYTQLLRDGRAAAVDDLRRSSELLRYALVGVVVAALVMGILLWVFLRRWVTEPLAALAEDARTVADGDVAHAVPSAGPGEVGEVAHNVEQMRRRLVALIAEAAQARTDLEASHARLEEQAEELRRSNRDLEQFAYVASHDLQEPLRKVASFTQLLARRYEGQLDDRADLYIGFAVDGAKRMQRLISDLLGFSRVGRIGGELAEVDLAVALDRAREELGRVIEDSGATVTTVPGPTGERLPTVRGEEPLLVQLLVNLVGNAIKFRHPDRAPSVRVDARRVGDFWEMSCADNGIGIDPQFADRVFVIFQRLHAKEVYEGTGIGLALCKRIVEFHGGDIWVDRDVAQGTTIRWTLPVADSPTQTEPQEEPAP